MSEIPDDLTEEQLANLLALMKSKEKNDYSYLSRPDTRRCPVCGEVFTTKGRGRPKKFCSERCRTNFHHRRSDIQNWKTVRTAVCEFCGEEFLAAREYRQRRKYCSHACANRAHAAERRKQRNEDH